MPSLSSAAVPEQRPLLIGIDARAAAEPIVGRGRVVQELLRALHEREGPHGYRLYARQAWKAQLDERFRWRVIEGRDPWWHVRAARAANRECDVFLSSNSYLTTWFLSIPAVPIVYDMVAFDRAARPRLRSAVIERLTLGVSVRRSAALIAISQATADALAARFPGAAARTTVAPLATASRRESRRGGTAGRRPAPGSRVRARGRNGRAAQESASAGGRLPAAPRRPPAAASAGGGGKRGLGRGTFAGRAPVAGRPLRSARVGVRCRARRALPPLRGVLLPVPAGGFRPPGAGGDERGSAGGDLRLLEPSRGRRRRR